MRVLILGCGYVGLALGEELVRQGHEVYGVRHSAGGDAEMRQVGIHPRHADLTQPAELAGLPGPYDWVVNSVSAGRGGAAEYRRVYLEGTRNIVRWLGAAPPQRYVYTSSSSVYGQTDGAAVTESSPAEPPNETGQILLETEQALLAAWRATGFPAIILRAAGIYGPERGYWLRQWLEGHARLEGQGDRFLNMIHRDDLVGAIIAALHRGRAGQVYNAVDHEPVTQLELFRWLSQALGQPLPPAEALDAGRKRGWTNKRVLNTKLTQELGCTFHYPTFRAGFTAELQRLGRAPDRG